MNKLFLKKMLVKMGIDLYLKSPDRDVLEQTILPWISTLPATEKVLFVGCEWYTCGYRKWFRPDSYWTLDYDPAKQIFGSQGHHITDSMTKLAQHFDPDSLDLVICNGVFGWGLDAPDDIEAAFSAVGRVLRPGGLFLFGWNDVPGHRPMLLGSIQALEALKPQVMEPLGVSQLLTPGDHRHTFNLFSKP